MLNPRILIFRALLLDVLGQVLILGLILWVPPFFGMQIGGSSFEGQGGWLLFSFLIYPVSGWLFGSFTVLRWRRLTLPVLLQRLVITAVASLVVMAVALWLINPADSIWLVYRSVQIVWMLAQQAGHCWCAWHWERSSFPGSPRLFRWHSRTRFLKCLCSTHSPTFTADALLTKAYG